MLSHVLDAAGAVALTAAAFLAGGVIAALVVAGAFLLLAASMVEKRPTRPARRTVKPRASSLRAAREEPLTNAALNEELARGVM